MLWKHCIELVVTSRDSKKANNSVFALPVFAYTSGFTEVFFYRFHVRFTSAQQRTIEVSKKVVPLSVSSHYFHKHQSGGMYKNIPHIFLPYDLTAFISL